jgi:ArsR family transcriptional regulator
MATETVPKAVQTSAPDRTDLVFKALASRPRREILHLLATGAGKGDSRCCSSDEVCACVLSDRLGLGAPTVSHHMKTLLEAGLVAAEKRGQWVYYRLESDAVQRLIRELSELAGYRSGACR